MDYMRTAVTFPEQQHSQIGTPKNPIHQEQVIYQDSQALALLSQYPNTKGHTCLMLRDDLFSLDGPAYIQALTTTYHLAAALKKHFGVVRCALIADGSRTISILPLHGLSNEWHQISTPNKQKYYEKYPGYITSMEGPTMADARLDDICATVQAVSRTKPPYNNHFEGDASDQNLFARIVRGELPQRRIWEDEGHVAVLSPFANTPGFTVVVPRSHLSSDIFSLERDDFEKLIRAAYTVAQLLKKSFGNARCGMIFEGFEIDYTHVKLPPIHQGDGKEDWKAGDPLPETEYQERYVGFVTSLEGPSSQEVLLGDTVELRAKMKEQLEAKRSSENQ